MAHDYKGMAARVYDIFERGAVDEVPGMFAPNFIEHDELPGSTATGIALVQEWVRQSKAAFPDVKYTIESVVGSGEEAVVRARMRGTHKGTFMGIPPTGKKVDVLLMDWVRINPSGKFTEHWGVLQESKLMTQLGIPQQAGSIDLTTRAGATVS